MVDAINNTVLHNKVSRVVNSSEAVTPSAPETQQKQAEGFVSSSIRVDNLQNVAILEYRSENGEVVQQYPTQAQINAFKAAAHLVEHSHQQYTSGGGEGSAEAAPSVPAAPLVKAPSAPVPSVPADGASNASSSAAHTSKSVVV